MKSAKSILLILLASSYAPYCSPIDTENSLQSLQNVVKNVLTQFGRNSFKVGYSFQENELLHPADLKSSGWDSNVRAAWAYLPEVGKSCHQIQDIKSDDQGLSGSFTERIEHHGDTTHISKWEVNFGSTISYFSHDAFITKSGDTDYVGGNSETGGSLSLASPRALYFNGIDVIPEAEIANRDTLIYEDDSGNRLVCTEISSIAITLSNGFSYFSKLAPEKIKRSKTFFGKPLPLKCPPDTGEIILGEIKKVLGDYSFTVKDDDALCKEAIFRTRADCRRYERRCSKVD